MLLSAVSVLVVTQSIFEIPEGLMNNPVYIQVDGVYVSESYLYIFYRTSPFNLSMICVQTYTHMDIKKHP